MQLGDKYNLTVTLSATFSTIDGTFLSFENKLSGVKGKIIIQVSYNHAAGHSLHLFTLFTFTLSSGLHVVTLLAIIIPRVPRSVTKGKNTPLFT